MRRKILSFNKAAFTKYGAETPQELWAKAAADGCVALITSCDAEVTKGEGENAFDAIFSTDTEDRHRERVFQSFDLKAFKKNPVYLDSHNYWSIEDIIGRVRSIGVKEGVLKGVIEFATENPKGALAKKLAEGGFLNASSIGFIPKEFDQDGNILKSELLEISAVSIPANPEALYENAYDEEEVPPADDPPPAPVEEEPVAGSGNTDRPVAGVDARGAAAAVVTNMLVQRKQAIAAAARAISEIQAPEQQKRKVYQSLRALLKSE
jgi:HK97 family phage prohead protease